MSDLPTAVVSQENVAPLRLREFDYISNTITDAARLSVESLNQLKSGNLRVGGRAKTFHFSAPADGMGELEAALFRHRGDLKVLTSQVAMHFSAADRARIFKALDELLSMENWEDESVRIDQGAYRTFLRFLIFSHPVKFPNMGVSARGGVLAGWHTEGKSIHGEFLPGDFCVALLKLSTARGPESLAWRGPVTRLRTIIEHNEALDCIQ